MFLCNLVTPVPGRDQSEAEDKMALIEKLPLEIDALSLLSEGLNYDFASKASTSRSPPKNCRAMQGMLGIRDGVLRTSARPIRARAISSDSPWRGQTQDAIVGGPKEIATGWKKCR